MLYDAAGGMAHFSTTDELANSTFFSVRLSNFSLAAGPAAATQAVLSAAAFDTASGTGFFGNYEAEPAAIVAVALRSGSLATTATISPAYSFFTSAVALGGFVYFASDGDSQDTILQVATGAAPAVVQTLVFESQDDPASAEYDFTSAVVDAATSMSFWGTGTCQRQPCGELVVAVSLGAGAAFANVNSIALADGETDLYAAALDPVSGVAYFACYQGIVVKVNTRLATGGLARLGALTLGDGLENLQAAAIDAAGAALYLALDVLPGVIAKVRLADFVLVGSYTLPAFEGTAFGSLFTLFVDAAGLPYAAASSTEGAGAAAVFRFDHPGDASGCWVHATPSSSPSPSAAAAPAASAGLVAGAVVAALALLGGVALYFSPGLRRCGGGAAVGSGRFSASARRRPSAREMQQKRSAFSARETVSSLPAAANAISEVSPASSRRLDGSMDRGGRLYLSLATRVPSFV